MSQYRDSRCNKIAYLLQRSEDLETLLDLKERVLMGLRLTVKEVFMSDYLKNAYPVEHEEILREMRIGTLTREQIISHALRYSQPTSGQNRTACNCEACRDAENTQINKDLD